MKISEHLLCIFAASPDPLSSVQFDKWLAQMKKAGLLEPAPDHFSLCLTEKGIATAQTLQDAL